MPDELDNQDLPDDAVVIPEGQDDHETDPADDGDDFDFSGLTQEEIDAINTTDGDDDDSDSGQSESDNEDDATNDAADNDDETATETAVPDAENPDDRIDDADNQAQDNFEQEAATVAQRRTDIDTKYDAALDKLDKIGEQYDKGEILDGAYNSQKTRIERELKRLEASESELVTKEDAINTQQASAQEKSQQEFTAAATDFMSRAENAVFVEGTPEFTALDQQLSVVAANMPEGTPYNVLLDKARVVVGSYMTLPDAPAAGTTEQPAPKKVEQQDGTMPSISNMPAVVPNSTGDGKFAHLDKLDGPALERAQAEMSEEQLAEYLTS